VQQEVQPKNVRKKIHHPRKEKGPGKASKGEERREKTQLNTE